MKEEWLTYDAAITLVSDWADMPKGAARLKYNKAIASGTIRGRLTPKSSGAFLIALAVALPVESDPVTLAKTIATLDHLSGGRVTVGAGFGWNTAGLADHGVPAGKRRTAQRVDRESPRSAIISSRSR